MIHVTRLLGGRQIADQIQGLLIPLGPTTQHHDGTIRLSRDIDILELNQLPRLETCPSSIEAKGLALPRRRRAHGRTADIGPTHLA